jgi:phosphoserine phosphatase RsbU/P
MIITDNNPETPAKEATQTPIGRPRRGLARKVFAFTFPVIALVVFLTQVGVAVINYREQLRTHLDRARLTATLTAEALARPVWNLDQPVFESQVRAIEQDDNFRHARLLDEKGRVLFQTGNTDPSSDTIEVRAPIKEPGGTNPIGEFILIMSTAELRSNAYFQAGIGFPAIIILLVGFFITLHIAIRRLVGKPLNLLLDAMSKVERKEWTKVDMNGDDEIFQVVDAFNRMVDSLVAGDEAKRLLIELEQAQKKLLKKNDQLQKANRLIIESIQYARRIQTAMLPDKHALDRNMKDIHVCWEPLHLVGGDYFWLERFDDQCLLAVMDCTGHGVPGAFMTLVVASALDRILREERTLTPSRILTALDEMVRARLRQDKPDSDSDDGLEAAICLLNPRDRTITFAGAGLPLIYAQDGEIRELKGNRDRLGYHSLPPKQPFRDHILTVQPNMTFYLMTDGIPDHMGGDPPRLLGKKRLAKIMKPLLGRPLQEQLTVIQAELETYRGHEPRRDDMTMIAFSPKDN